MIKRRATTDVVCPECGKIRPIITRKIKKRKSLMCHSCAARKVAKEFLATYPHPIGKDNPQWKGGKTIDGAGYVQVILYPNSPFYQMGCKNGHRVREHRLIMAQFLERCLSSDEHVHHKNGNKTDNRLENLQLTNKNSHYPTLHLLQLQEENNKLRKRIIELENKKGGK